MIKGKFGRSMMAKRHKGGGGASLPALNAQTLYLSMDNTIGAGTFTRSTNAWNPDTGLIAANNLKLHSEFENGTSDLSTLSNVSIGSLTGFTNAAVFAAGSALKYFQWGAGIVAPAVGEPRVYSCYIQMADLSAPDPSTGVVAGKDMYITQGAFMPTYIGQTLVDATNSIYRVYWASAAGDTSSNVYLQQAASGSGKSFKASGCMIERVTTAAVTTPSTYIKTTSAAVYMPRYVAGKSLQAILVEEASTNSFLNSTTPITQNISVTTANSGKWTCSVVGAGTVTSSAGTATATGYGAATAGSPRTITVTGNGTVTFTVDGADATTRVQVENLAYPTSHIVTGAAAVTRGAEVFTHPASSYLTAAQGTIMAWVKVDTNIQGNASYHFILDHGSGANDNIRLYKDTLANIWTAQLTSAAGASSAHQVTSALSNGWHHIAMTWNASELALWLDGVKQASPTATPDRPTNIQTNFYVGSTTGSAVQSDMPIDQLRIFNRPLTASEVAAYYNRGK